jgi:glutamyl endopeptidase
MPQSFGGESQRRVSPQHMGNVRASFARKEFAPESVAPGVSVPGPAEGDNDQPVQKPTSLDKTIPLESVMTQGRGMLPTSSSIRFRGEAEVVRAADKAVTESDRAALPPLSEERLLDAWHATYSSTITIELASKGQEGRVESIQSRGLPSEDDRGPVGDRIMEFPWRCICYLIITAADGSHWVGSGWLAGPRVVITAGHCVYLHGYGGWAQQVKVYPACNGQQRPFQWTTDNLWSVKGWTERQNDECDYGAILLPEPLSNLGFFDYEALPDEDLQGILVNIFGYPTDKQPGTLWGHSCTVREVQPRKLMYNKSCYGGQSGCPVFYKHGDERSVIGIHTHGDLAGIAAIRIAAAVLDNIEAWKSKG